jgi:hypothetical protein
MKALIAALLATTALAKADIVSTNGLTIVSPPPLVTGDFIINSGLPPQLIFPEQQDFTLLNPLVTDTGIISAGTIVNSFFFALNAPLPGFNNVSTSVTFDAAVLGLIYLDGPNPYGPNPSPFNPNFANSNFLGAIGTIYALGGPNCGPFCGFEPPPAFDLDTASFVGNTAFFNNYYSEPGDFARIITQPANSVSVPGPTAGSIVPLLKLLGLMK